MTRHARPIEQRLISAALLIATAVLLVAIHRLSFLLFLAAFLFSVGIAFYRPVGFIYLLIASTLFAPEIPVAGGIGPNIVLMAGFSVAVLGRMVRTETWTLPHSNYASVVLLFGIVGLLSLLKSFIYFDVPTVAFGALFLGQWFSYLLVPILMAFYLRDNARQRAGVLSFTLFASAVMALYLLGLLIFDVRPIETTIQIAGHRPLVAFWQQGNLAVGMFMTLTSLVSFGLAIKEPRERITVALYALSALCGFLTLTTLARSAILGLAIGYFCLLLVEYRWKTLLAIGIAAPLGMVLAPEWLIIRFTRSTLFWREVPALGIQIPIGTLWKRVNGWVQLGTVFVHNPLFGVGFSLSQERMAQLLGARISPDNHYVAVLVETGLMGFAVFWLWVRLVFWRLFEAYREASVEISGLALGMIGAFVAFLVWGFFQGFYARWRVLGPLFIYIGVIYAAYERSPNDGRN